MPKVATPPPIKTETKKPAVKAKAEQRPIIYDKISVKLYVGDDALTAEQAKEYLGWQEVDKGDFHLTDRNEKKVRLCNNYGNREWIHRRALMYMQLILHRQWELNLEAMIIGECGMIVSAQHRLVALVLAVQEWTNSPDEYPAWKTPPVLECIINRGCKETDRVINTIDTGEPRSFADVIFRSHYFANMDMAVRSKLAKMTERAVQWIEHRTKAREEALSPLRPHAEGEEFLTNHGRIIKCIKHVYEENGKSNRLSGSVYLSPGYIAAMMYLMSTGQTEPGKYRLLDTRSEKSLSFTNWDTAETFIVELAGGHKKFAVLREVIGELLNTRGGLTRDEGCALLAKAWLCYIADRPIRKEDMELKFETDDDGKTFLGEHPSVGGIDYGSPDDEPETDDNPADPTPEEIEQRAAAERNGRQKGSKKKQPAVAVDMQVWVAEDGGHFTGKVTEIYDSPAGQIAKIFMRNKKTTEAKVSECLTTDPNGVA